MTPEDIDTVRKLIASDRHVTQIETSLDMARTLMHSISHDHLKVKKVCTQWIPHNQMGPGKSKLNSSVSKRVYDVVMHDKTWIYSCKPEIKQQSTVWVFPDDPRPTKVICSRSASK